jgi:hypothetical protein
MCRSITTKPVACSARLFVGSMGRWGEEAEVRFPVLARPFGQVPGVLGVRHAGGGCLQYLFPVRLQRLLKVPRRHLATRIVWSGLSVNLSGGLQPQER